MKKHKLLFVFGTRPEALKMAPVILAAKKDPRFQTFVCLTAQHREMVDQVMKLFHLKPDFDLNIMQPGQTLGDLTHRLFEKIEPVFQKVKPSVVLVQGDTTSAFAIALKAFYDRIPIAHIEAGLRSFNKYHPFPEEVNRVMISHIGDFHFPPTKESEANLLREGVDRKRVFVTGNTVVDALQQVRKRIKGTHLPLPSQIEGKKMILVTAHRRENFGAPLESICKALKTIHDKFPQSVIVYPVHLNPQVQTIVRKRLEGLDRVLLLPPLSYSQFVRFMDASYIILTDSGGIQEEAPSFRKPALVMREVSERPDGIKLGVAKLVGTSTQKIVSEVSRLMTSPAAYKKMVRGKNPYGDGNASKRILNILAKHL